MNILEKQVFHNINYYNILYYFLTIGVDCRITIKFVIYDRGDRKYQNIYL